MRQLLLLPACLCVAALLATPADAFRILTSPAAFNGTPDAEYTDIVVASNGVVYATGNPGGDSIDGLWAVPTPASPGTTVTATRVTSFFEEDVNSIPSLSPNEQTVYYTKRLSDGFNQVFSRPVAGGSATQLTFATNFAAGSNNPRPAAGGARIVINTLDTGFSSPPVSTAAEWDLLYSVPAAGGTPTLVAPAADGDLSEGFWDLTPDGMTVVYTPQDPIIDNPNFGQPGELATIGGGNRTRLLSVPVTGGPSTPISLGTLPSFFNFDQNIQVGSDGYVYFIGDYLTATVDEVFRVPLTGGEPQRVSDLIPSFADVKSIKLSPDASVIAYVVDAPVDSQQELYVVRTNGLPGQSVKVNIPFTNAISPDVDTSLDGGLAFLPNSSKIYYLADGDIDTVSEIYVVNTPTAFPAPLRADFNGDGQVNAADYTVWRDTLDLTGPGLAADIDGNQVIGTSDLAVWRATYGLPPASLATAVPEPASLAAAAFAALAFCGRTRRPVTK
jgi:hypothetical protein